MVELLAAIGSVGTISGIAAVFTLALWMRAAMHGEMEANANAVLADHKANTYEAERDAAVIERDRQLAIARAAAALLDTTQAALVAANQELVKHARDQILSAPPADAARLLDELLARPLSGAGAAAGAAAHGAGDRPAAAVPAATAAPTDSAPRDPVE